MNRFRPIPLRNEVNLHICPLCKLKIIGGLREHYKGSHTEEELQEAILNEKDKGTPDVDIGGRLWLIF